MTLIFNRLLEIVKIHVRAQNFLKLSAAIHEWSCSQSFDDAENTELCTTYQFQKHLSNQINRCGPTLHAYVQLSRSEDVVLNRKASS